MKDHQYVDVSDWRSQQAVISTKELFAGLGGFRLGLEAIGGWEFVVILSPWMTLTSRVVIR